MKLFKRSGQSTAEYAILIGLVVGVLVVMQTYIKRGIQGKVRDASDTFAQQISVQGENWKKIGGDTSVVYTEDSDYKQYEFEKYSAQRTRETLEGTETTESIAKGDEGKVKRDIVDKTVQQKGDYQEYDYKLGK